MRQFAYDLNHPDLDDHCWAYHNGLMAGTYDSTDKAHIMNWGLDEAVRHIQSGLFRELKLEEFMYLDRFNRVFLTNIRKINSEESSKHLCNCDFSLILQKGCQCNGY